ncbi:c-type cytochrome [Sedimenticola selenatireducens]|jgi:mono/diheme cytochrome c family protein|uniref:Cytochrome c n=1 Tax=Sedimenticola selenatireducens TaxID=191960 RepID=A0A558DQG7_9GAMM|nr:cytochrome c [Sedimenticola selenatireducens]TVO73022.1 cytochrome c [Sedimenticola selenatireducens]TVT63218.1 MAG: cytochrome c [Sedimenticola selenatireducens]
MKPSTLKALTILSSMLISPITWADKDTPEVSDPVKSGEYIFNMGGCSSCHTAKEGKALAGGLAMETPFGVFYTPNITPDKETGIGDWSDEDFIRAMTKGEAPDGSHYYPTFPYTSYSKMSRHDLLALKDYLNQQTPVVSENRPHDLSFPFNLRSLMGFWKMVNFDETPFVPDKDKSQVWNRGAYIVNGPGHCGECHSPRNLIGGVKSEEALAGNLEGPEGEKVPGLTMAKENRVSQWSDEDLLFSIQIGMTPDGDFLGGSMGHVIENSTGKLSQEDLKAIIEYLRDSES